MEVEDSKKKSTSILKKLEKYLSTKNRSTSSPKTTRSKSWSGGEKQKAAPIGCFSVYVGPEKERFVIKTESLNHPLFKMLLEDAELEYGFSCDGPLHLPCHADLFRMVLAEMECSDEFSGQSPGGFSRSPFCSPARRRSGGASYRILSPSGRSR